MLEEDFKAKLQNNIGRPIPQNPQPDQYNWITKNSISVPFFGDIETAKAATISINPSEKEFVSATNKTTHIPYRSEFFNQNNRIGNDKTNLDLQEQNNAYTFLKNYFTVHEFDKKTYKPYCNFFGSDYSDTDKDSTWLEGIIKTKGYSYYDGSCIHLDITPWATNKWPQNKSEQADLIQQNDNIAMQIISKCYFGTVFICGQSAINEMEKQLKVADSKFKLNQVSTAFRAKIYTGHFKNTNIIAWTFFLQNMRYRKEELTELKTLIKQLK